MTDDEIYLCVGVCLPDEDEAYCIGCGRPWGEAVRPAPAAPAPVVSSDDEQPDSSATSG